MADPQPRVVQGSGHAAAQRGDTAGLRVDREHARGDVGHPAVPPEPGRHPGAQTQCRQGGQRQHERDHALADVALAAAHGANPMSGPAHTAARQGAAPDGPRTPYPAPVARQRPVGTITRGTTNPNRLRRVRPLAGRARRPGGCADPPVRRSWSTSGTAPRPSPPSSCTTGCGGSAPDVEVVGIEIDPARVAAARPLERPGLDFRLGGFEVPLRGRRAPGRRAGLQRAAPVRRGARSPVRGRRCRTGWPPTACSSTAPATSSVGRSAWVAVGRSGPLSLTLSLAAARAGAPLRRRRAAAQVADPPQRRRASAVHAYLTALDRAWARQAPHGAFGARQRFLATAGALREEGWPLLDGPSAGGWASSASTGRPSPRPAEPVRPQPSALSGRSRPPGARCRPRRTPRRRSRARGRPPRSCWPCGGACCSGPTPPHPERRSRCAPPR